MKKYKIVLIEWKDEMGNPQRAVVGEWCDKIDWHSAQGEGDKWFWEIYRPDGSIETIFYPTRTVSVEDKP